MWFVSVRRLLSLTSLLFFFFPLPLASTCNSTLYNYVSSKLFLILWQGSGDKCGLWTLHTSRQQVMHANHLAKGNMPLATKSSGRMTNLTRPSTVTSGQKLFFCVLWQSSEGPGSLRTPDPRVISHVLLPLWGQMEKETCGRLVREHQHVCGWHSSVVLGCCFFQSITL